MSESIPKPKDLSLKSAEFAQVLSADLIIILVGNTIGPIGELHDFASSPDIASKLYVLVPQIYHKSYSASGILQLLDDGYGGVHWYEEEEMITCHVLDKAIRCRCR
jgi:hypothetical protein